MEYVGMQEPVCTGNPLQPSRVKNGNFHDEYSLDGKMPEKLNDCFLQIDDLNRLSVWPLPMNLISQEWIVLVQNPNLTIWKMQWLQLTKSLCERCPCSTAFFSTWTETLCFNTEETRNSPLSNTDTLRLMKQNWSVESVELTIEK